MTSETAVPPSQPSRLAKLAPILAWLPSYDRGLAAAGSDRGTDLELSHRIELYDLIGEENIFATVHAAVLAAQSTSESAE